MVICGSEVNKFHEPDLFNTPFIYFLKTTEDGLPYFCTKEECDEMILNYFTIGSLKGNMTASMDLLLNEVIKKNK